MPTITAPTPSAQGRRTTELVLFDWNGTVMDDLERAAAAANQALARFGVAPLSTVDFQHSFTLPLVDWLSGLGIPEKHAPSAAAHWNRAMEVPAQARASAHSTLTRLRGAGILTGIVTAADPKSVDQDITANGLLGLFDLIHTGVTDKAGRLAGLRNLADHAVYVGDTAYDIVSARDAGFTSVSIAGGYQHPSLLADSHPNHHIDDLDGVLELRTLARASHRS